MYENSTTVPYIFAQVIRNWLAPLCSSITPSICMKFYVPFYAKLNLFVNIQWLLNLFIKQYYRNFEQSPGGQAPTDRFQICNNLRFRIGLPSCQISALMIPKEAFYYVWKLCWTCFRPLWLNLDQFTSNSIGNMISYKITHF